MPQKDTLIAVRRYGLAFVYIEFLVTVDGTSDRGTRVVPSLYCLPILGLTAEHERTHQVEYFHIA